MPILNIPAKPYVKHYLELAYGTPVDLTGNPRLNTFIRRSLRKPSSRYDNRYSKMFSKNYYATTVDIVISEDDFYRYGWEITRTDTVSFNREVEEVVKFFMRTSVAMYENFMQQKDAIRKFQDRFGFCEDIWTFEAIRKDYYRNAQENRLQLLPELIQKIETFFLVKLSEIGTYSHLAPQPVKLPLRIIHQGKKQDHSG